MSISQRLAAISDIINEKRYRGEALTAPGVGIPIDDDENDDNQGVSSPNSYDKVVKRRRILAETMSPLRLMFAVQRTTTATTTDDDDYDTTTAPDALVPMDPLDITTITASKPANDALEIPSTGVEGTIPKTLIADTITQDFVQYLKEQSKLVEESNQKLTEQRTEIFQSQTRIWNTYLEGLSTISQLTDLRHAPDAIMPHNF
ncbi:hypothetical protein MHU86_20420 [Fragilaria crotonensis]|nr:hypothetical protein MHU86_20420 [Fragilaria crotonensis]